MSQSLKTTIHADEGYILMKFSGDLSEDTVEDFKKGLAEASSIIVDCYHKENKKVHILLDMNDFTGKYSVASLTALTDFAKKNKPFVDKTASFGGSDTVKMAGEIVITLSGRDNIKIFDTQEEAKGWILT